jgi:hypothetical protein
MKVALCMPTGRGVVPETAFDFTMMYYETKRQLGLRGDDAFLCRLGGPYVAYNRSEMTKAALEGGADFVMQIDSDQTFPPDGVMTLLNHSLPIVGATYRTRKPPQYPFALPLLEPEKFDDGSGKGDSMLRCAYLPGGFTLVSKEVYSCLAFPYYRADYGLLGRKPEEFVGEDVYFGETARAAGFDIWLDFDLTRYVGHVLEVNMRWGV